MPIHVGSLGKNTLPGCQRDDEGENISDRNFTFCEMSGQYWAWKNIEADYVGQCHYRRYFCFDGGEHESNDHAQIEDKCLSPLTISKYHLDDEDAIAAALDGKDMLIAPYWSVKGVPTPCGPKKTVREHMIAYGLVTHSDVDALVRICREVRPEYADELVSYLDGDKYLGYNCFIMKKQFFDRLCDFEFSILQKFDSEYDYSHKTTTHKRICGYFGEILYSVFVAHVRKEGATAAERPLVFFDATPALPVAADGADDVVNIVWRYIESTPAKFAVALRSLIEALDPNKRYRLVFIHNVNFETKMLSRLVGKQVQNLEFVEATFPTLNLPGLSGDFSEEELHIALPALLPRLFKGIGLPTNGKALWIEGCCFFQSDPASILQKAEGPISVVRSVFLEKELNKPVNTPLRDAYIEQLPDWYMAEATCVVVDLQLLDELNLDAIGLMRDCCTRLKCDAAGELKTEYKKYLIHKKKPGTGRDTFCLPISAYAVRSLLLNRAGARYLPLAEAYPLVGDGDMGVWANEETVKEFRSIDPSGIILYAPETTPFAEPEHPLCVIYWLLARQMPAYEPLLMTLTEYRPMGLKGLLFPEGTRRKKIVFKVVSKLRALR